MVEPLSSKVEWLLGWVIDSVVLPLCLPLIYRRWVPDFLIRFAIRQLLASVLVENSFAGDVETQQKRLRQFIDNVKTRSIAEQTKAANEQHYEVPAEIYVATLGPYLKYSSCLYHEKNTTLKEAEAAMLATVCTRAKISSSQTLQVLDLGCGWGSFTLYAAERFPDSQFTAVSNSKSQREFILATAKSRGLTNVRAITCDINDLSLATFDNGSLPYFDRVVTNEMFEHMKNYDKLMRKVASLLKAGGLLFVHIFTHKRYTYHFVDGWMARTFFTGGTMPGQYMLLHFQKDLVLENQWAINGNHYSRTLEDWLRNLDTNTQQVLPMLRKTYGSGNEYKWLSNWRLFYLACSELFKYNHGNEWFVSHYTFTKPC